MGKAGENLLVLAEAGAKILEEEPVEAGFNEAVRESTEITANVDKGFDHYIKCFRHDK
jgi:hypothetical protein